MDDRLSSWSRGLRGRIRERLTSWSSWTLRRRTRERERERCEKKGNCENGLSFSGKSSWTGLGMKRGD